MAESGERDLISELIKIAARLVRAQHLPSDDPTDWPARVSGRVVADHMGAARAWTVREARNVRQVADQLRAVRNAALKEGRRAGRAAALLEAEAICDDHSEKNRDIHSRVCARNIARLLEPAGEEREA
jgi:hypothetical protein